MAESWNKMSDPNWAASAAWQTFDDLRSQLKQRVEGRMRRGDVRATVLRLLSESPMHGYQIIHEIETRSGGAWKPSPGSVYPTLQLLADEGLIEASESGGRRTYSLTEAGAAVAAAEADRPAPWDATEHRAKGPKSALAMAGLDLARAAAEVARIGSTAQIAEAESVLEDARRALHALLAQD